MSTKRKYGTGSIEQDSRTHRYRGRFRHNYTMHRTKYFATKREAESAMKALMSKIKKEI